MKPEILIGPEGGYESLLRQTRSVLPFDAQHMQFVGSFSEVVLTDVHLRRIPDLAALAFWMRPVHVTQLQGRFRTTSDNIVRVPRGLLFHLAPSNVDTLFAYSLFVSILLGNRNVVRLSSHSSPIQEHILNVLRGLLSRDDFSELRNEMLLVRYPHDDDFTAFVSAQCDCRVIWGGDDTVRRIGTIPLSPNAVEVKFANKWSIAVIDSSSLLKADSSTLSEWVTAFVNDSYWYGQSACSSPRIVCWIGSHENNQRAQKVFWPSVEKKVEGFNHQLTAADFVNKLVAACYLAATNECEVSPAKNNLLTRVATRRIDAKMLQNHCGAGLFYELDLSCLSDLGPQLFRQIQTMTYVGVSKADLVKLAQSVPCGIDRIVPFGRALAFDVIWDGYNLFEEWTRSIVVD